MKRRLGTLLAIIASCAMLAGTAQATCRHASSRFALVSPLLQAPFAGLAADSSTQPPGENDPGGPIVGLWLVTFNADGQVFDQGYDQWHSDGTEILNDIAPPQPANGTGTMCLGVFKRTGARTYKLKHPYWSFDANGNLNGTGVITESVILDASGNSYRGTFTNDFYDLSGNLLEGVTGTLTATRITPD